MKPAARAEVGRAEEAWAWGDALPKFGHLLTVETGGFDVCQIRSVDQIRLKAWQALPVEEANLEDLACLKSSQVQASGGRELENSEKKEIVSNQNLDRRPVKSKECGI